MVVGAGVRPVASPAWGVVIATGGGGNAGAPVPRVGSVEAAGTGLEGVITLGSVCANPLFDIKQNNENWPIKKKRHEGIF